MTATPALVAFAISYPVEFEGLLPAFWTAFQLSISGLEKIIKTGVVVRKSTDEFLDAD